VRNLIRFYVFFMIVRLMSMSTETFAHGGGLNKQGCHNNKKTGDYHCHRGSSFSPSSKPTQHLKTPGSEAFYNNLLADALGGRREVRLYYNVPSTNQRSYVIIDIETSDYVIEGGLDKRSSLDSVQQAVFASTLTGKKPAVAIYDTDGVWGRYEHRVWSVTKELGIRFIWFDGSNVTEK
jgi:hypothetical protein